MAINVAGATSLRVLEGKTLGAAHGDFFPAQCCPGASCVALHHPSYYSRTANSTEQQRTDWKKWSVFAFAKAREACYGPGLTSLAPGSPVDQVAQMLSGLSFKTYRDDRARQGIQAYHGARTGAEDERDDNCVQCTHEDRGVCGPVLLMYYCLSMRKRKGQTLWAGLEQPCLNCLKTWPVLW